MKKKLEGIRSTNLGLQNMLFLEMEIPQESMDVVGPNFKTEIPDDASKRKRKIESIKENLTEVDKNYESLLEKEKFLRENCASVDDIFQAYEQHRVCHKE